MSLKWNLSDIFLMIRPGFQAVGRERAISIPSDQGYILMMSLVIDDMTDDMITWPWWCPPDFLHCKVVS